MSDLLEGIRQFKNKRLIVKQMSPEHDEIESMIGLYGVIGQVKDASENNRYLGGTQFVGKGKSLSCHSCLDTDSNQIPSFIKGKFFETHVADRLLNSRDLNRAEDHER